jgi:hypothetical protein
MDKVRDDELTTCQTGCRAPQAGDGINNAKVVVDVDKCGIRRECEMEGWMIKR